MFKRSEESKLTSWYFEIDRRLLGCVLLMIVLSVIFALSAGSVAAERIGQPWHFFLVKAIPFYIVGLTILFGTSFLNKKQVLLLSAANLAFGLLLLPLTVLMPNMINNSARFVDLGPFNVMPSDIMKPGFIIITAYFLAKMKQCYGANIFFNKDAWRFNTWLSWSYYLMVFLPVVFIVFNHPDLGTSILYLAVFSAMIFIAGMPLFLIPVLGGVGLLMLVVAFFTLGHVHRRIIAFFTGTGDTYQVDNSVDSIRHGGLLGSGDDAFVKQYLPDVHTDFIFAAIAEDLGAIMACGLLVLLFFVFRRLITNATNARDLFVMYATGGAAALFGTQICFNMLTTLNLFAPKGMTLPFISYGGSSLLAYCLLFGMILAIVREDKWK
ncbi:MAG: FtsW/RodA/SpoVE family cell cycle protein [Alphaproteobacteria bacterium]|nr:FtsW/RodA/SpoVE family cell cycle protein [Alphaproteobacteria bacterium]MBR6685256.1 FtsW/RodA/SpoVE family cell cycle protein [Alphaproteobacteria bacterium]